jgi:amino acid transporter
VEIQWTPPVVTAAALGSLWLIALATQLADLGTARFDARRLARGTRSAVRLHPVAWTIPLAAIVIVATAMGADAAAHQLFELGSPLPALLTALMTAVLLVTGWLVVMGAVTHPAADSYRVIRDELVDLHGVRVHQDVLDELRLRLDAIEESGTRPEPSVEEPGSQHEPAADELGSRREPAVEETAAAAVRWVFRRPQRIVPPVLAIAALIALAVSGASAWVIVAGVVAVLLSVLLALAGARASLRLLAAVRATQHGYRAEALQLLADAEKTSRKRVQGLGDRVSRALQILREQQD